MIVAARSGEKRSEEQDAVLISCERARIVQTAAFLVRRGRSAALNPSGGGSWAGRGGSQLSAEAGLPDHTVFGRNEPALHSYRRTYPEALGMKPLAFVPK